MTTKELEITPPEDQWTEIVIERPKRVGPAEKIPIKVPFTRAEVDEIIAAREAVAQLKDEAMRGSGLVREIYAVYPVPWGYTLVDRQRALEKIRQTNDFIAKNLPTRGKFIDQTCVGHIHEVQTHLASLASKRI